MEWRASPWLLRLDKKTMIRLREALIGKKNVMNASINEEFVCFCVYPNEKDKKMLEGDYSLCLLYCHDKRERKIFFMSKEQVKAFIRKKSASSLVYGVKRTIGDIWSTMEYHDFESTYGKDNHDFVLLTDKEVKEMI